jgi:hypothetical protein
MAAEPAYIKKLKALTRGDPTFADIEALEGELYGASQWRREIPQNRRAEIPHFILIQSRPNPLGGLISARVSILREFGQCIRTTCNSSDAAGPGGTRPPCAGRAALRPI